LVTLFLFAFDVFSGDEFGVGDEVLCRGFINRSAIGVGVWWFVEGVNTAERSGTEVA
jgi:hypothetical protein